MVLGLLAESLTLGAKLGAAYLVERLRKSSFAPVAARRKDAV
jgi:hypothetical protein